MKNIVEIKIRGLHLYYQILKLHKNLPPIMQKLGNTYVRQEFELNKQASYEQYQQFLTQWFIMCKFRFFYKQDMEKQQSLGKKFGRNLDSDTKAFLNQDQEKTLKDLKNLVKDIKI